MIITVLSCRAARSVYHYLLVKEDDDIVPCLDGDSNPEQLLVVTAGGTLGRIFQDR